MKSTNGIQGTAERILWIDVFRAFLIFAIAMSHAVSDASRPGIILNEYLYSFHVPAFFLVSGYLFGKRKGRYLSFVAKKAKGLLVPYLIFSLISIVIFFVLGSVASEGLGVAVRSTGLLPSLIGMLYANGVTGYMAWNLPLWFLPCLFLMSCAYWPIKALVEKMGRKMPTVLSYGIVVLCFLTLSYLNYYIFGIRKLPFGAETAVYQMPFFMAGDLLREKKVIESLKARTGLIAGAALTVIGALPLIWLESRPDPLHSKYHDLSSFYLFAFASALGYMLLFSLVKKGRIFSFVGRNTLSVLLMHKFPIVLCQLFLGGIMAKNGALDLIFTVLIAAASCALSLLAGWVIGLACPFAIGLKGKKREGADRANDV